MTKLSGPMLAPRSGKSPRQIVVLLHGYGADGEDLIDLGRHWGEALPDALFVSPNAPNRCADNPFGYEWFPLQVDRIAGRIEGAREAAPVLRTFLADLWTQTGLGAADTILVGFSQGAMMALHVGTAFESPLKAIVAFSGALVPAEDFGAANLARPPIILIHGDIDQVVDPQLSRDAETALKAAGFPVTLHLCAGLGHGISPEGLALAAAFMREQ
jgi:phospholipase/carboxylesterase